MTELGEIELRVPRTRTDSGLAVVRAYARRAANIDRMILTCFVLGLSTRKVAPDPLTVPTIAPFVFPPCLQHLPDSVPPGGGVPVGSLPCPGQRYTGLQRSSPRTANPS